MAKLARKHQKIFAESASDVGQFGSAQTGTKVITKDLDTIQALSAFVDGWSSATLGGSKLPTIEERNAVDYAISYQLAYLFENGFPEYSAGTTYYSYSIVRKTGTYELYGSLVDNNTGNALPSQSDNANWTYLGSLENLKTESGVPVGAMIMLPRNNIPTGYLECNGATFSASTYPELNTYLGGNTLPDMRGEFPRGWDNGRGVDSGRVLGSFQSDQIKSHSHSYVRTNFGSNIASNSGASANAGIDTTGAFGGDETRPRNVALIFAIKAE